MPVNFLSDAERERWQCFPGTVPQDDRCGERVEGFLNDHNCSIAIGYPGTSPILVKMHVKDWAGGFWSR